MEAKLMDFGTRKLAAFMDLTDELVELVRPFAEDLGCLSEVEHARSIARRGTSADEQLRIYKNALARGENERDAQVAVVDWLIERTTKAGD
jgi:carboxylate-amine ligase